MFALLLFLIRFCECQNGTVFFPILFFTTQQTNEIQMDRWIFDIAEAYVGLSNGKSSVWGYGYEDYNMNLTLRDNIVKRFGSVGYFTGLFINILWFNWTFDFEDVRNELIFIRMNLECTNGWECVGERKYLQYTDVFFLGYAKEAVQLAQLVNVSDVGMIVHFPNVAPASIFTPVDDKKKTGGAILVGALGKLYPMRMRFKALIEARKIPGAIVYKHPGYFIGGVEKQRKIYIETLQKYKIALFCASILKYQVKKYVEAAIAGDLIIATLPDEDPEFWAEHIVQVNLSMTDDELIDTVKYWLDHDAERIVKAKNAQKGVLPKYSTEHGAQLIAESLALYISGFRGAKFYYPFVDSCSTDRRWNPNKWCSDSDRALIEEHHNVMRKSHEKKKKK